MAPFSIPQDKEVKAMLHRSLLFLQAEAEPIVLRAMKGATAILTLNRPKALNALSKDLSDEIAVQLTACEKDPSVSTILITGAGRAFVAGADIKYMQPLVFADMHKIDPFAGLDMMRRVTKPIIGAVNGFCLGGGCEFAMCCDILIASEKAVFGQPEIKLGVIPGLGGTQRLPRLIGKARAMEWLLTGAQYSAEEAARAGLVSRVVKHEELMDTALKMAETINGYSQLTASLAKDCCNKSLETSLTEGLAYEKRTFNAAFSTKDQKEGMGAFIEKRAPKFVNA